LQTRKPKRQHRRSTRQAGQPFCPRNSGPFHFELPQSIFTVFADLFFLSMMPTILRIFTLNSVVTPGAAKSQRHKRYRDIKTIPKARFWQYVTISAVNPARLALPAQPHVSRLPWSHSMRGRE
jgi:hypothetical protein